MTERISGGGLPERPYSGQDFISDLKTRKRWELRGHLGSAGWQRPDIDKQFRDRRIVITPDAPIDRKIVEWGVPEYEQRLDMRESKEPLIISRYQIYERSDGSLWLSVETPCQPDLTYEQAELRLWSQDGGNVLEFSAKIVDNKDLPRPPKDIY